MSRDLDSCGSIETVSRKYSFDRDGVPLILRWSIKEVGEWIKNDLGFPQYEDCFVSNYINGRKLILIDASSLQKLGVQHFEHIEIISKRIREILGVEEPHWNRSITLPPRDTVSHFLERKSVTGHDSDALTFEEHIRDLQRFDQHSGGKVFKF